MGHLPIKRYPGQLKTLFRRGEYAIKQLTTDELEYVCQLWIRGEMRYCHEDLHEVYLMWKRLGGPVVTPELE